MFMAILNLSRRWFTCVAVWVLGMAAVAQPLYAANDLEEPEDKPEYQVKFADHGGHMFLGGIGSFGMTSTSKSDAGGVGFRFGGTVGYEKPLSTWSRISLAGDLFIGNASFKDTNAKSQVLVGLGALGKFGYGYSLGSSMFGYWTLGIGPALTKFSSTQDVTGLKAESTGTNLGFMFQLGFEAVIPMTSMLDVVGGVTHTRIGVDTGDVKVSGVTTSGTSFSLGFTEAQVGIRFKI